MNASRRGLRLGCVAVAFALGIAACLTREPLTLPLTLDNQHYYFVAERAASGVPPHVSHFDSKHALSMLISAAGIRLARATGTPDDFLAARFSSILVTGGSVALVWAGTFAVSGGFLAAHLATLAFLGFDAFFWMAAMGSRPKVFLVFFLLAALWAVARRRSFAAGVFAAGAFLCWQPALLVLGAAFAVGLFARRPVAALSRLALGAALPLLLYHGYFLAHAALAVQIDQAYLFPARFMTPEAPALARNLAAFFAPGPEAVFDAVLRLLFAGVLAGFWLGAVLGPRRFALRAREAPGLVYAMLCGAGTLAFTLYDHQSFVDLFFVLPFVAVVVGWALAAAVARLARERPVALRGALSLLCVGVLGSQLAVWPAQASLGPTRADQEALARRVGALLEEGSVYAVGCTHLLAMNRVDNHVRYGFFFRGMEGYLALRANSPEGYRPLRDGEMPDVILVSRPFVPGGRAWLTREYEEATPPQFRRHDIRLWRRRAS